MKNKTYYITIILLIIVAVSMRLLDHPVNFTPLGALAFFTALYLPRRYAIVLPIFALCISDIFIGFYAWQMMCAVYGSFIIVALIALYVKKHKSFAYILGGTVLGSILFFLITNMAVWIFGTIYTHDFGGLLQSYYMAIPFFRNSLLGDLFYTSIFVGTMEFMMHTMQIKNFDTVQIK